MVTGRFASQRKQHSTDHIPDIDECPKVPGRRQFTARMSTPVASKVCCLAGDPNVRRPKREGRRPGTKGKRFAQVFSGDFRSGVRFGGERWERVPDWQAHGQPFAVQQAEHANAGEYDCGRVAGGFRRSQDVLRAAGIHVEHRVE